METAVRAEVWRLNIPMSNVPYAPQSTSHVMLALLHDAAGRCGAGYSRFYNVAKLEQMLAAVPPLVTAAGDSLDGWLDIERRQERLPASQSEAALSVANAFSMAAWDLAGQQRGLPCADLWGRPAARDSVECYSSGLFKNAPIPELIAEARGYRTKGYRKTKLRVGRDLDETLARLDAVREIYTEPESIALEVMWSWDVATTNEFVAKSRVKLAWLEDAVKYDSIGQIEPGTQRLAAGETCQSIGALLQLHVRDRVPNIIIDVQAIGGPVRFLEAARMLSALGATVGAHRFPHQSIHLLACLPQSMPVETVDWANPALGALPAPDSKGCLRVNGPGFAATLDRSVIERHGQRVI